MAAVIHLASSAFYIEHCISSRPPVSQHNHRLCSTSCPPTQPLVIICCCSCTRWENLDQCSASNALELQLQVSQRSCALCSTSCPHTQPLVIICCCSCTRWENLDQCSASNALELQLQVSQLSCALCSCVMCTTGR